MSVAVERLVRRGHRKLRVYEQHCAAVSICIRVVCLNCRAAYLVTRSGLEPLFHRINTCSIRPIFISVCVVISVILDVPAGVTQEEGHTGFLIHLPSAVLAFIFSREGFNRPFPSSTVKSNFVFPRTASPGSSEVTM